MTNLEEMFEIAEEANIKFEDIVRRFSTRRDLHAFILLDTLTLGTEHLIMAAEHDQIWLSVDLENLSKIITQEQVNELEACGVWICDDAFTMFI